MSTDEKKVWICPECKVGKHGNCNGIAWDFDEDEATECGCDDASHRA